MASPNIFEKIPKKISHELTETILESRTLRIERIVSRGHTTKEKDWYDQEEDEWVIVLQGRAVLEFKKDARKVELLPGDYLSIPAHEEHRVHWTDPAGDTIWLAVFYS